MFFIFAVLVLSALYLPILVIMLSLAHLIYWGVTWNDKISPETYEQENLSLPADILCYLITMLSAIGGLIRFGETAPFTVYQMFGKLFTIDSSTKYGIAIAGIALMFVVDIMDRMHRTCNAKFEKEIQDFAKAEAELGAEDPVEGKIK